MSGIGSMKKKIAKAQGLEAKAQAPSAKPSYRAPRTLRARKAHPTAPPFHGPVFLLCGPTAEQPDIKPFWNHLNAPIDRSVNRPRTETEEVLVKAVQRGFKIPAIDASAPDIAELKASLPGGIIAGRYYLIAQVEGHAPMFMDCTAAVEVK